ncbi:MAG: hypothetical protein M0R80_00715 [Proteobacteria bacterium]|jgi:hypothetical protein|nr:hypothetical protein [Pseudomonadota bacterium]
MTYKNFSEIIKRIQAQQKLIHSAYKLNIDLVEFNTDLYNVVDLLLEEVYGKEGKGWFDWFIYERNGNPDLKAWDADKKPICYSVKSLWEYLEKNCK